MNPETKGQFSMLAAASASSAIIGTLAARALGAGASDVFADQIDGIAEAAKQALSEGTVTAEELNAALWAGTGSRKQRRAQLSRIRTKYKKGAK